MDPKQEVNLREARRIVLDFTSREARRKNWNFMSCEARRNFWDLTWREARRIVLFFFYVSSQLSFRCFVFKWSARFLFFFRSSSFEWWAGFGIVFLDFVFELGGCFWINLLTFQCVFLVVFSIQFIKMVFSHNWRKLNFVFRWHFRISSLWICLKLNQNVYWHSLRTYSTIDTRV